MAPRTRLRALGAALAPVVLVATAVAYAALPQQSGNVDLATQVEFRVDGNAGDVFGEHTSPAGDVNGDGLGDVIAASGGDGPSVVFGRSGAGTANIGQASFGGFRIIGGDFSSGSPVAGAGDQNGDGLADVIVGTPGADRAWVIFGKTDGTPVDLGSLGAKGFMLQGVAGEFGGRWVSSAGDMNGDGRRELIVGAEGATRNARNGSGAAYVVFGKASTSSVDLNALGSGGFVIEGAQTNHFVGEQVAGGPDVNGDGIPDVAVSASGAKYSFNSAGAVYVVFGKSSTTDVDLLDVDGGAGGFRIDGSAANDALARSLAVLPDMNGDGRGEVAVGADSADPNGLTSAGSAWVVFGKASGAAVALASLGSGGFRVNGQDASDQLARSLGSAGDVNGDGAPDLMVGALNAGNNGRSNSGSGYVIFGRAATSTVETGSLGSSGFRIDGAMPDDFVGRGSNGAGDFNGDGRPDVVVGAEFGDNNGANSGSIYIVSGFGTPTFAYPSPAISAVVNTAISPLAATGIKRTHAATFSVAPALPAGLAIDPATGTISGTPTVAAADAPYVVTMTDAAGSATATVNVAVNAVPTGPGSGPGTGTTPPPPRPCTTRKTGTRRGDKLIGTSRSDLIRGRGGNDFIRGQSGNDCLFGDAGNDQIEGGRGNDKLDGGKGRDNLVGGRGKDRFNGGAGNDKINSKDGIRETVNCGKGRRDRVKADKKDRLRGCEKRLR